MSLIMWYHPSLGPGFDTTIENPLQIRDKNLESEKSGIIGENFSTLAMIVLYDEDD